MSGMSRSGALAVFSSSTHPATIINPVAPIRPVSKRASRRSAQRVCATATAACTCCCAAMAGTSTSRRHTGSTMSLACNCAKNRRRGASKRSSATIGSQRANRTRHGRWTSSTTSWRPAGRSGCSRSSTRSHASVRHRPALQLPD